MQHWYNLSDGAMEDALYEIASMRLFARLSLDSALPDRTTIMNFRHLLEQHQLARQLFKTINRWLAEAGVMMTQGTLVDATIIEAPSSTKNKEQQRDPEMHQTKKGNQWHFGMKAHIGVDAKSGLTHSLVTTAANEHDLNQPGNLLHGEEQFVSADAGYQGAPQREELAEVDVDWLIAERPGRVKTLKQHPRKNKTAINIEYMSDRFNSKAEHQMRVGGQFSFIKFAHQFSFNAMQCQAGRNDIKARPAGWFYRITGIILFTKIKGQESIFRVYMKIGHPSVIHRGCALRIITLDKQNA